MAIRQAASLLTILGLIRKISCKRLTFWHRIRNDDARRHVNGGLVRHMGGFER